jgi:hypothetical protein
VHARPRFRVLDSTYQGGTQGSHQHRLDPTPEVRVELTIYLSEYNQDHLYVPTDGPSTTRTRLGYLHALSYLDNIAIWSTGAGNTADTASFEQMMTRLELVLERLAWAGLSAKQIKQMRSFRSLRAVAWTPHQPQRTRDGSRQGAEDPRHRPRRDLFY